MLTKWWILELTLATNFGSHAQMVTKFGDQILATKFGFVPDWSTLIQHQFRYDAANNLIPALIENLPVELLKVYLQI